MELTQQAFEEIFILHYKALHGYAFLIVRDGPIAEDIVGEVFFRVWSRRSELTIESSIKAYLYKAVYHECMDHLKKSQRKSRQVSHFLHYAGDRLASEDAAQRAGSSELERHLYEAVNELPEQCRTIFQLSRVQGLTYREIAGRLDLSIKTVEVQMGRALKRLRVSLAEFLTLLIIFLWNH